MFPCTARKVESLTLASSLRRLTVVFCVWLSLEVLASLPVTCERNLFHVSCVAHLRYRDIKARMASKSVFSHEDLSTTCRSRVQRSSTLSPGDVRRMIRRERQAKRSSFTREQLTRCQDLQQLECSSHFVNRYQLKSEKRSVTHVGTDSVVYGIREPGDWRRLLEVPSRLVGSERARKVGLDLTCPDDTGRIPPNMRTLLDFAKHVADKDCPEVPDIDDDDCYRQLCDLLTSGLEKKAGTSSELYWTICQAMRNLLDRDKQKLHSFMEVDLSDAGWDQVQYVPVPELVINDTVWLHQPGGKFTYMALWYKSHGCLAIFISSPA